MNRHNLEPAALFDFFDAICQIPHASKHEEQISAYLQEFGMKLGYETISDKAGNVLIKKPAYPGYEDCKTIILQGHMDMVCDKLVDKDIDFMGYTFNFAKMDGVKLDKMLKTLLFTVEFPDANTIKYGCHYNNEPMAMDAPIAVEGNKMTVKMSEKNAAFRDIDLYTFQDQDNTQMHMYMHSTGFVNFFGNMQVTIMEQLGLLDTTDAAAVKAVFQSIDEAVETINVSFVMTRAK